MRVMVYRRIAGLVGAMILLREVLSLLPALSEALEQASCALLSGLAATLGHPVFPQLLLEVEAVIDQVSESPESLQSIECSDTCGMQ